MESISQSVVKTLKTEVNNTIDHTKISSLKMLFFALVPKTFKLSLNTSRLSCLRRGLKYQKLEVGMKNFEENIDVVKLLRQIRWNSVAIKNLMKEKSISFRNDVQRHSQFTILMNKDGSGSSSDSEESHRDAQEFKTLPKEKKLTALQANPALHDINLLSDG